MDPSDLISLTLTKDEAYLISLLVARTGDSTPNENGNLGTQNRIGKMLRDMGISYRDNGCPWSVANDLWTEIGGLNHIQVKHA